MGKTLKKYLLFDLDTTALKEEFGPKRYTVAYSMIRQFLENCGFEHKQGSRYLSTESISLNQTIAIYQAMTEEMPWLDSCSKTMPSITHNLSLLILIELFRRSVSLTMKACHDDI